MQINNDILINPRYLLNNNILINLIYLLKYNVLRYFSKIFIKRSYFNKYQEWSLCIKGEEG